MNAATLFRDAARAHPMRIAFIEGRSRITYAELWERVCRFSGSLHARGFAKHDRALILIPMSIELYVALLATLKEGGIAVFIDPWVSTRTKVSLARHAELKAWLGVPKSHLLRPFVRGVNIAPLSLTRFARGPLRETIVDDVDRALITFTTGSSGHPKGVHRTHRILIAQHERLAENFPAQEGDVDLCTFPVFALNNLALGVTTVIPPADAELTTAAASPPFFDELAQRDDRPRFRRILTGGAPVTDLQLRAWTKAWPSTEIVVAYGSSEAEPVAHVTAAERLEIGGRGYIAGKIVKGVRARIERLQSAVTLSREDDEGSPASGRDALTCRGSFAVSAAQDDTREIGELLVAGDHVCREYDGDTRATRLTKVHDPDGTVWHRMGDTGWFDEEGRFRIAGRVHTTIWRSGKSFHAQLLEQTASGDDPRIKRAAALQVGARIAVVIESDADVADEVRARLAAADEPCDIVLVTREPLPVDPRHHSKIDYVKLRARL